MKKNRLIKNILFFIPAILYFLFICLLKVGTFFYHMVLMRNEKEGYKNMINCEKELAIVERLEKEEGQLLRDWAANTKGKAYYILSHDGLVLHGHTFVHDNYNAKWAVIVHGYGGRWDQMHYASKRFFEAGYNILAIDLRGHGESQGDYIGMGYHDSKDIAFWVDKIAKGDKNAQIILYGVSMGAAAILMSTGEGLSRRVKCLVEDCGYTSVKDEFTFNLKNIYKLPPFPFYHVVEWICKIKAGYSLTEASALQHVASCDIPIFFIHGAEDRFVPTEMVYRLYSAAKCPKELMIVKNAGHGIAYGVGGPDYWNKVYRFCQKYININAD